MEFYNREREIKLLEDARNLSEKSARMTVITGRRRIGKTTLAIKAFEKYRALYFFVARKSEILLCREFIEEIELKLNRRVMGEFSSFARLFEYLLIQAQTEPFTLIIDEFPEFSQVNKSVYSEMQNLWDRYKETSRINLVLSGSVYSMMRKIFENEKEPLFGRANERLNLQPFNVNVIRSIVTTEVPDISKADLLAFYTITGGVAKYVELFVDKDKFTFDQVLSEIFRESSLLIDEGKNILIEEFGKDYTVYFSILSLIASSKTSRSEIESILVRDIGGYLDRLENEYNIIRSIKPVLSKPGGRIKKYFIDDNFLSFWFRFVYKYRSAVEIGNFNYVRQIVERDFDTYSGIFLEKYFREKLAISGRYTRLGKYWERGNRNELDIVAIDDLHNKALIAEVKTNKSRFRPKLLRDNAQNLINKLGGYEIEFKSLSLEDI
ncbi:MAG: ATP-binding protein [Bacteroidales bacterium]|nr:ATP-binding protein [Bacteroidales bacterium]